MLEQIVIVILIMCTLIIRWKRRRMIFLANQLKSRHIALPFIGHSYLFLGSNEVPTGFADRMKLLQKIGEESLEKGGMVCYWQGKLYLVVSDPVVADIVLKTCLEKNDATRFLKDVIGNGSLFAPVNIWRPRRKMLAPTFSPKKLYHFMEVFSQKSAIMVNMLQKAVGSGKFSVWKYFSSYSMDSICETTLGVEINAQTSLEHPFIHAFDKCCQLVAARVFQPWYYNETIFKSFPVYQEYVKHKKLIKDFIEEIITKKISANGVPTTSHNQDGLKTFLEQLLESGNHGKECNSLLLQEETLVLVLAGTDTSAVGASFTTVMLSKHPEVQEKVYQELQEVFGDSNRPVVAEDLPRLKYLEATIKETLRLYPPAPFIVRTADKDLRLPSGLTIVAGCDLFISIWALHRNRTYWGEDAELFRPERFIDSTVRHPAAFIPFSYGPRNCLGYQYALMSMKTALASLLRQYKIKPPQNSSHEEPNKTLRVEYEFMLRHVDNFVVELESRN